MDHELKEKREKEFQWRKRERDWKHRTLHAETILPGSQLWRMSSHGRGLALEPGSFPVVSRLGYRMVWDSENRTGRITRLPLMDCEEITLEATAFEKESVGTV